MKLSVIVPIYNVEKYLRSCLDSILVSALHGYEIIAIDDGSTDRSSQILAEYAQRYPRLIRAITTENCGLGHARNTGISVARGEYLMFVDSDDRLRQQSISEILPLLDGSMDVLIFDLVTVTEQGRQLTLSYGCAKEDEFTLESYPDLLLEMPNVCNKIWRRSLFTETGIVFPERLWFEDLAITPKLYLHCKKICYQRQAWYVYLQRKGSITNNLDPWRNREMIEVIHSILDHYKEFGCYEQYKSQLEYLCFYHELLTSTTRVNLIDPDSPIQEELLLDYLSSFPDFRNNPYVKKMPPKHRLLTALILHRRRHTLHRLMTLNNRVRRKEL